MVTEVLSLQSRDANFSAKFLTSAPRKWGVKFKESCAMPRRKKCSENVVLLVREVRFRTQTHYGVCRRKTDSFRSAERVEQSQWLVPY